MKVCTSSQVWLRKTILSLFITFFFADDMNECKLEYAKFGKVGLNNHVSLCDSNMLQSAHQWTCFCMKKHLGVALLDTLFHMCKSGQLYPN